MNSEYNYIYITNDIMCHIDSYEQVVGIKLNDKNKPMIRYKKVKENIFQNNAIFLKCLIRCYNVYEPLDLSNIKVKNV